MKRKTFMSAIILLVLLGLILIGWRLYLAHVINGELGRIRAAHLPTNGEELNSWYPAVPNAENAALVMTQAFALRQLYPDGRSNLVFNFKLPGRGQALSPEEIELLSGYIVLNE